MSYLGKLNLAWNRYKFKLIVRLIASINRQQADAYALWDDAMAGLSIKWLPASS